MLKKSHRLTKQQFETFFRTGKRLHFAHVTIVYTPYERFHGAVVVGKKVARRAVVRNRLRRRVYAQLYQQLGRLGYTGVYIVLTKPSFASLPRRTAIAELQQAIAAVQKKT